MIANAGQFSALHAAANLCKLAAEELSDLELIARIAAADEVAMQVLYRRHHDGVLRFACRILRSAHAAEDVASDVFLDVWHKAASFEGRCEVATWLFTIARNKSISARRRRAAEPWDEAAMELIEDASDAPDAGLQKQDADCALRKCLGRLSPAHRAVIEL